MCSSIEDYLVSLTDANDWEGAIEIGEHFSIEERSKFLWAWPTVDCLKWMKRVFQENGIENILSIGCGSGLLEWIVSKSSGVRVNGLELDKSWWQSTYSPQTFVNLKFNDTDITNDFLRKCANIETDKFALLFCYFNNRNAFLEYIRVYEGDFIILVGPMSEEYIVTDPNPLNPKFETDEWSMLCYYQLLDQNLNCICIFKRFKSTK